MRRLIPAVPRRAYLALLLPSLAGCGLMFGGTRQSIQVTSAPDGAKVTTTPATIDYTTPTSISLERKSDWVLTFEKEGYSPAKVQIQHHMRGGILALDILFTGLLGIIPDAATGAWNGLSPSTTQAVLTKVAMVDGPETIQIGVMVNGNQVHIRSSAPGVGVEVAPAK